MYVELLIISQVILVPILGLLLLGIRAERKQKDRQIRELVNQLQVVSLTRRRRMF